MEVDGKVNSKKKLDQRKRELVKQMRKIDEFTDVPQNVVDELKEKVATRMQDIEQRRNSAMRIWVSRLKKTNVVENSQAKMDDNGHKIQAESLVEAERDLEITGLQAGDGRRGCIASQSIGCCLDASIFQQFVAMGAEQAV